MNDNIRLSLRDDGTLPQESANVLSSFVLDHINDDSGGKLRVIFTKLSIQGKPVLVATVEQQ